jgi:hypothetical protein
LVSFDFGIAKQIDNIRTRLFSAMKRRRFSTKKTGSSRVSRSFLDIPDKTTLKRRHSIDQQHGLWRSSHCSQIRLIDQLYIWKFIKPSMTKEPGKKYRGK